MIIDRQRQTKCKDSNEMARCAKGDCVTRGEVAPRKSEAFEFYQHRKTTSHPIIMNKFLGL
jgi:hypothetical protein